MSIFQNKVALEKKRDFLNILSELNAFTVCPRSSDPWPYHILTYIYNIGHYSLDTQYAWGNGNDYQCELNVGIQYMQQLYGGKIKEGVKAKREKKS